MEGFAKLWIDYHTNGKMEYYEEYHRSLEYHIAKRSYYENEQASSLMELTHKKKLTYSVNDFYENGSDASRDHDNDGLNDAFDDDDDNDNILDVDEVDGAFGNYRYDHDNDGIWDMTDLDDDNDGLSDWFESNDGNPLTGQFDHDNDGSDDHLDTDDDDDGILDELEV